MSKNTLIIVSIAFLIVAGGSIFLLGRGPKIQPYQKEQLIIEQDLIPIELTQEEQQVIQDEGLQIPSGEDPIARDLQSVRSSDELDAIEADINETDLSGLDSELEAITSDLQGL